MDRERMETDTRESQLINHNNGDLKRSQLTG